jgi:outer membrane autotransporter protein
MSATAMLGRLAATAPLFLATGAYTQPLDQAVNAQLQFRAIECRQLLNANPGNVVFLTGQLLEICTRGSPAGGSGNSSSTGGGASTPTSLPGIVQQHLRDAGGRSLQPAAKIAAASADADNVAGRGFFISIEGETLDRDRTAFEDGFNSRLQRATVGVDFGDTKRWIAGVALDASRQDLDFNDGGDSDVESQGITAFGAFLPTDRLSAQFYLGYDRYSYDRRRNGSFTQFNSTGQVDFQSVPGRQSADYKADQYRAGILVSYAQPVAKMLIRPFAGLDWKRIEFGAFSEAGPTGLELTFYDDKITSLQSGIGVGASVALPSGSWVLVPSASISWKHEYENDQRTREVSFVGDTRAQRFTYQTDNPDRDWAEINLGIMAILPNGLQALANYRTITGNSIYQNWAATLGLRIPF